MSSGEIEDLGGMGDRVEPIIEGGGGGTASRTSDTTPRRSSMISSITLPTSPGVVTMAPIPRFLPRGAGAFNGSDRTLLPRSGT